MDFGSKEDTIIDMTQPTKAEIGPAQDALCGVKNVSTRASRAAAEISAMGLELCIGDHMQGDDGQ